jgi:hypothetical protein
VGEPIRRAIVICPNCGEDNADSFRFCGMCGTVLETRREARRPAVVPVDPLAAFPPPLPPLSPKISAPEPKRPFMVETATAPAGRQVPPISGPSMLGLDQPIADQPVATQLSPSQTSPSLDSLREKSFSGLDSFLEPEQPKTGGRRILIMAVLLAALGGAGWWTYTNYLSVAEGKKPAAPASSVAANTPAEKPSTRAKPQAQDAHPAPDNGPPQVASPSASTAVPESPAENANAGPDTTRKGVDTETKTTAGAKPVTPEPAAQAPVKPAPAYKSASKRGPTVTTARPSNVATPAAPDTGDAAFRKGEAYLYGRGAPQNCDEAVKNLKAASAKSNAKARSAFGTMYATGHCVPRDLPTSYLWFALALRIDPNNQILEKDLSAIWNQMTPPERQMATRMKE